MESKPTPLAHTAEFNTQFGLFYFGWAVAEAMLDCAVMKFLRLNFNEAHILTAGMEHGRKSTLLRSLIARSDHKNKSKLLGALNTIQNESLRNAFAHSYIASDSNVVTFLERSRGGPYSAKEHNFTLQEFSEHVGKLSEAMVAFQEALELESMELQVFQAAALSVKSKT